MNNCQEALSVSLSVIVWSWPVFIRRVSFNETKRRMLNAEKTVENI